MSFAIAGLVLLLVLSRWSKSLLGFLLKFAAVVFLIAGMQSISVHRVGEGVAAMGVAAVLLIVALGTSRVRFWMHGY